MAGIACSIGRLVVVGLGLIGGSLARALRESGAVGEIVGVDADPAAVAEAVSLGVVERGTTDVVEGVSGADIVFVAVPVRSISSVVAAMVPGLQPGTIVTDGGSVKVEVVRECEPLMPAGVHFIGGHPIAGTEHSGVAASFASLYRGKRCIVTPTATTNADALRRVSAMWEAAGSDVIVMDPERHDAVVAAISHLPHMVAYSLVNAVAAADDEGEILNYSAGGFRDFTRIASSHPVMWRDIALLNREPLLRMMDNFSERFDALRALVARGDAEGLESFFATSKKNRDGIL